MTFWESKNNYGQILQLFALQKIVGDLGHNPFLIRYKRIPIPYKSENFVVNFKIKLKNFLKFIYTTIRGLFVKKKLANDEKRKFEEFKKKYIVSEGSDYLDYKDLIKKPPVADVYIVGSDQVWNNNFSVSAEAFLLGFGNNKIKRIAYAASFGQKKLSDKTNQLFNKYIQNFNSVSVREESGVDICMDLKVSNPEWVLDPTLLFTKEDWIKMLELPDIKEEQKSIFIYTLGNSKILDKDKFIGYANSLKDYKVVHASANSDDSGNVLPTIPEWVNYIKNAELVITTSFHGMVFCILNNTNFIVLPNTGHAEGMNERIYSVLTLLNLEEHMIESFSEKTVSNIFSKKIDWNSINNILENKRKFSIEFLKNAIN